MVDAAAFGVVVNLKGFFEMNGDLCAGLDIDRREGLAVEPVHPLRHVLHAAGEDASDRLVGADADRADRAIGTDIDIWPLSESISEATPAPAAVIKAWVPRYCCALLRRSPLTQGIPYGSLIQPRPSCWLFCWLLRSLSSGIVRTVPSWNTNVMLRTCP